MAEYMWQGDYMLQSKTMLWFSVLHHAVMDILALHIIWWFLLYPPDTADFLILLNCCLIKGFHMGIYTDFTSYTMKMFQKSRFTCEKHMCF